MAEEIHIPALAENGNIVVPETWLGKELVTSIHKRGRYVTRRPIGPCHSYIEYEPPKTLRNLSAEDFKGHKIKLPTLAVLRHAYLDKNPDVSWVSPEFRETFDRGASNNLFIVHTEYTSTRIQPRKSKRGEVIPKGYTGIRITNLGHRDVFDLAGPPRGWVTRYNLETGFPEETSENGEDAAKIFGDNASYFSAFYDTTGVIVVGTHYPFIGKRGPFPITIFRPHEAPSLFSVGGRRCRYR